jgi:hypothetical protein
MRSPRRIGRDKDATCGQLGPYDSKPTGIRRRRFMSIWARRLPVIALSSPLEDVGMDLAAITRMQIRVVLTAFRSQDLRMRRLHPGDAGAKARERLRVRSVQLLDAARARLNGEAVLYPELLSELKSARDEVTGHERSEVSAGSRGGRPG